MEQAEKQFVPRGYKRGVWAGRFVTVKKPHWEQIQKWAKQSGMSQASFFRAALMRGALAMARDLGFTEEFPKLEE